MGTLLLHILFVSIGSIIGAAAGWLLRSASPLKVSECESSPVESDTEPATAQEAEGSFDHVNTLISRLHQLTASVAADVGEHNIRVQAINDELTNGGDVVSVIERLMTANAEMQSQLQAAEQRMQQQSREIESHCREARTDSLTKLANRRAFDDEIRRCLDVFHSKGQPSCVMMVDVDFFKKFNDTYGHQAGDEVLRNVARVLRREASAEDIVCRYGGEEFAVIYPGSHADQAIPRAEKSRAAIAAEVMEFQGMDLRVTASGGVAELRGRESAEEFVKRADVALYVCKEKGRNCGYWHDGTSTRPMKGLAAADNLSETNLPETNVAVPNAPAKATAAPANPSPAKGAVADNPVDSETALEKVVPGALESSAAQAPASSTPLNATTRARREPTSTESEDQVFQFNAESATPKISRRDRITGLSDYGTFCADIDRRLAEYKRDGNGSSLLMVCVDDSQQLVESYGSQAVDVAFRNTAQAVKACRREMDHAARCSERVFGLLVPGVTASKAKSIADRIRQEVQSNPLLINGQQVRFTVSVGITEFWTADERELVLERVNESLDAAQAAGGNRTIISDSSDPVPNSESLSL